MGNYLGKEYKEDYIDSGKPEEFNIIVQYVRKYKLLLEFKEYIKKTNQHSIYHKHMVNAKIIETENKIITEKILKSTLFFTLWEIIQVKNDKLDKCNYDSLDLFSL